MSYNKVARGDVLSGGQEIVTKEFLERFGPYISHSL